MGGTLSHVNNKLSFSFQDYIEEREELASLFRDIAKAAAQHRETKGKLQVLNGASGVTAGVAGAVALALSPATFGLSVPAAAVMTTAIVGNSLAAASLTSSVASYGFGRGGDEAITKRLQSLQCIMDSISKKDEEINKLIKSMEKEKVEPVVTACHKLRSNHVEHLDKDKRPVHIDLPLSVLKSQGIFLGAHSIIEGTKQVKTQEELETALLETTDALDEETRVMKSLKNQFKYLSCVPGERELPRGRLTYIDGGNGCSRDMVATFKLDGEEERTTLKSNGFNVLFLPDGAVDIKVHFKLNGGKTVKQVDRSDPKQPWVKTEKGGYQVDVFDFERGDGVEAVFLLQGPLTHCFVAKAWDFGRHPWVKPRSWEWWENADEECRKLLPDLDARLQSRASRYEDSGPCGMDFACGSCFGGSAIAAVEA